MEAFDVSKAPLEFQEWGDISMSMDMYSTPQSSVGQMNANVISHDRLRHWDNSGMA
jgi:hypothetical protein